MAGTIETKSICYMYSCWFCFGGFLVNDSAEVDESTTTYSGKRKRVYVMETLAAELQLRSGVFGRRWLPIAGHLSTKGIPHLVGLSSVPTC